MSHELRTPLNGVIGFTRLTLKSELNPTQRDHLHTIERSANNLLTIINDVLDFSKLEAGKLILESIPFPLRSTLDDVVTLLAHSSHDKGLELTLNIKMMCRITSLATRCACNRSLPIWWATRLSSPRAATSTFWSKKGAQ